MTTPSTNPQKLDYDSFFAALRKLHAHPLIVMDIDDLQRETRKVLAKKQSQEEAWKAKLRYMATLRAGWNAEDLLVSGRSILSAEKLLTEMDEVMETTHIEFSSSPSGVLSMFWFAGAEKFEIIVVSDDEYNVIRFSTLSKDQKTKRGLSGKQALKKILKWTS